MKTLTIMTAAALLALPVLADDAKPATTTTTPAADTKACPTKDKKADKKEAKEYWLDIDTITVEAENGDPIAQYTVAYLTDQGVHMPKDPKKANEMYKKAAPGLQAAADKGHAGACFALAHMYAEGKGVDKDTNKAAEYHKKARECCNQKAPCCQPDNK